MKAYKLKEDYEQKNQWTSPLTSFIWKQGRLFVEQNGEAIALATFVQPTVYCGNYFLAKLKKDLLVEEVDLAREWWVHPHLLKRVRTEFEAEKQAV